MSRKTLGIALASAVAVVVVVLILRDDSGKVTPPFQSGIPTTYPVTELGLVSFRTPQASLPRPIYGRLLAKIDSSELLESFRPAPGAESCELEWLRRLDVIPSGVRPTRAAFLGLTRSGSMAFALVFGRPVSPGEVYRQLRSTRVRPAADLHPVTASGTSSVVAVTIGRIHLDPPFTCSERYYALTEKSALHRAFRDAGVTSMRRVFRFTEVPDRTTPGLFRVRQVDSFLAEARQRFPVRAARGYPDLTPAPNLENWFLLRLDGRTDIARAILLLRNQPGIHALSADFPLRLSALPDDPEFVNNNQWGLSNDGGGGALAGFDINIIPAWDDAAPVVAPVTVAMIDTGFKEDLDELRNRLWTNTTETPGDGTDNDCNGYVDDVHGITTYDPWRVVYTGPPCSVAPGGPAVPFGTHGTHVAGVLAAEANNTTGIAGAAGAYPVSLMNIAVGWCVPGATLASGSAELAEAILYAFVKGADIANIALSTTGYALFLVESLDTVLSQGLVVVASAGNDGLRALGGADPQVAISPAGNRGVVGVGGAQSDGRRWPSSNYGPGLALVAPAADVRTITFTSPTQTVAAATTVSGTSASAAFVSGVAAVILAKYPHVTAPYMRDWLRATARDLLDPNGTGVSLPGNDEWTGAGMLDAGEATTSLASALDQPLSVDILVERSSSCFAVPLYDIASGSPDLGITVQGASLSRWWLEYGSGDAPVSWAAVPIANPTVTSQPIDVARTACQTCAPVSFHMDVTTGHNYLNTDPFTNGATYTLKLIAENRAGRRFETYDSFRVVRAMIDFDDWHVTRGMSLVGRWGWPDVAGFADIRPGSNYNIRVERDDGSSLFQLGDRSTSAPWLCEPPNGRGSTRFLELLGASSGGYDPPSATSSLATYNDGWHRVVLNVIRSNGATDTDSLRLYVDNTHFPIRSGWPASVNTAPGYLLASGAFASQIIATDMGTGIGRRVLLFRGGALVSLDTSGVAQWRFPLMNTRFMEWGNQRPRPVLSAADVDGDGVKEIAVVGTGYEGTGSARAYWSYVHLLKADGTPFNGSWPIRFRVTHAGNYLSGVPAIHVADVAGDARKELIFFEQPINYYGIRDTDIRPGYLHVVDLNAQPLSGVWPMQFPPTRKQLYVQTGDVDGDGKDDLLLEPDVIVKGDGTNVPAWSTPAGTGAWARIARVVAGIPRPQIIQFEFGAWSSPNYTVTLKNASGVTFTGWPQQFPASAGYVPSGPNRMAQLHVVTGPLVPGGDDEITLCYDRIRTLSLAGTPIAGLPDIDLQGRCEGIDLADVDGDGQLDYIVRLYRSRDDMGLDYRAGPYLDAFKVDGTRLSTTDNRWPVVLPPGLNTAVIDIDGDGGVDIVNVRDLVPYPGGRPDDSSRIDVLTVR